MRGLHRLLPVAVLVALAAAGYFVWQKFGQPVAAARANYTIAKLDRGDIRQNAQASGTLNPVSVISVGTQVSGVVKTIKADFNDTVKQGDVLAELDTRLLDAALAQSRAQLQKAVAVSHLAQLTLKRRQTSLQRGGVSQADVDAAEQQEESAAADVSIARSAVKRDETNLAFATILAPVSGVILSRDVDVGQTVAASFQTPTLFKIAPDMRNMQIDTNLSEADVGGVKPEMPSAFTVDAFPGRFFHGAVRQVRLNPTTVQNVVTYDVVIDVANPDLALLPGMTAFVRIRVGEVQNALRAPNAALRFRPSNAPTPGAGRSNSRQGGGGGGDGGGRGFAPQDKAVYTLSGSAPKRVTVTTGITDGKYTQITGGGLKEGDTVVTGDARANAQRAQQRPAGIGGPGGFPGGGAP